MVTLSYEQLNVSPSYLINQASFIKTQITKLNRFQRVIRRRLISLRKGNYCFYHTKCITIKLLE